MSRSIVITEKALNVACNPEFPFDAILENPVAVRFQSIGTAVGDNAILVATDTCNEKSRMLVIGGTSQDFFRDIDVADRATIFERCVRLGLRSFDKKIALNPAWMPFREDSRTSLFATSTSGLRIISEQNFIDTKNTFVFDVRPAEDARVLRHCDPDTNGFRQALNEIPKLFEVLRKISAPSDAPVELETLQSQTIAKGFAYDEWLPLLSIEQRDFVERPVIGPLRVRGAAGTGKTLAMVMKALKIAKETEDDPQRILFLTHSWPMAAHVDELIRNIGRDIPAAEFIEVYPLMEVSSQRDYRAIGRTPLGLDSDSGKRESLKIISSLISDFVDDDWIAYRANCSAEFVGAMEANVSTKARKNMEWDLLVEFGCVLAAQGMLGRSDDKERYLRIRRVGYMMRLANMVEREVVFSLWKRFLAYLKEEGLISTDQIVSDYLNELQTFYWEAKRGRDGFDYVFVDEMHLFNAQERLIFHNLLSDGDLTPKVVLALDPKQSPREVFTEIVDERDERVQGIYLRARLPNPDKVEFVTVYRYTEEIANLAREVMNFIPAIDMDEDWNLQCGSSVTGSGPVPKYYVEKDRVSVFKRAFQVAQGMQGLARQRAGQVAILCLDYERFEQYCSAAKGQFSRDVFIIHSRDDVDQLRYMNRRLVLSMPEYVAGLQFDSVVMVDANDNLIPAGNFNGHHERRFYSELYLGVTRAEKMLAFVCCTDAGGLPMRLKNSSNLERASL